MVLQQGAGGYGGCRSVTLWGPKAKRAGQADEKFICLRGTRNIALIRFDLPESLRGRKLARARLEVFVPAARKLRMICEIRCREVREEWSPAANWLNRKPGVPWTAPGGMLDTRTDYGRGRPPGVLDSYSLWEYDGKYFPHKYRFLGVPEGGKWIDFHITPLVRKWLADPASNHGVALRPVNVPDRRFPNTAEMDIPSERHPDPSLRPRLVLDLEPLEKPYLVGMTHSLRKFCDHSTRYRFFGPFVERYRLEMARNEYEGFQVVIYPIVGSLKGVRFEWTDLVEETTGARIPKSNITVRRQEVLRLHPNGKIKDWYFHGVNFDVPDPLVPFERVDIPAHLSTPFWFTVHTLPETRAGTYRGAITIRASSAQPRTLELTVKVWNFKIPEQWNFETMGQMVWGYVRRVYGKITPELKRRFIDFLLDHRFSPTQQYIDVLSPDLEDIPYCVSRGMSTIYLSGNFRGNIEALKQRYQAVEKLGLIHKAIVYIGDETSNWAEMRRRSKLIREACPEAMIMIGGSFPRPELDGVIDVFDPQIDRRTNRVYSLPADQMAPLIKKAQARGEKFFWYVAAGPMLPCPNVQMEEPLIAARVLFWITWKFGVTGFEYYCYNIWPHNLPRNGKRWPEVPFSPWGWGQTNGDGMLFYPGPDGPFTSVRFENIRDGIEDWESHHVLRDYLDALKAKAANDRQLAARAADLIARAEAILRVPDEVTPYSFTDWTWEPEVLLRARRRLGETIEEFTRLVSEEEMLAARRRRKEAELSRRRAMLRARASRN